MIYQINSLVRRACVDKDFLAGKIQRTRDYIKAMKPEDDANEIFDDIIPYLNKLDDDMEELKEYVLTKLNEYENTV